MKAFVTGGTGFIGASIVRELLREDTQVRALVRTGSDLRNLSGLDLELTEGDIRDPVSLGRAVAGCDIIFHAAADYRLWTAHPAEMYEANVGGTRNIMETALKNNVSRVVYTSTVGTLGNQGNGVPGDETTPVSVSDMVGPYKKSKFLAERAAESYIGRGVDLVIVNPSTPIGAMDIKPTPTGRIIVDFLNRKMPAYLDTGLNIIDVEECARGHLLAGKHGRTGEKYILGNQNLTLHGILILLSEITGLSPPRIRLPYFPTLVAAHVNEAISRFTGHEPRIPVAGVRMASKFMFFDSSKAVRELGLSQRPVIDALWKAVAWFKENGYVR